MKYLYGFIVVLVLIALSFGGCQEAKEQKSESQQLNVGLYDNPTNLDPRTATDAVSFRVIELVYDFLVRMDSTGLPRLEVAEKLENPSDRVYIFSLRKGVRFHDGQLLSAYDVAHTFNSILKPELNAPLRSTLEKVIQKITVLDSFRIKFDLKMVHAPFLSHLEVGIVPKHLSEAGNLDLKRAAVGSGPFKLVKWESDAYVELERNPDYWKGTPPLNKVLLKILPESNVRVLALENKEIDLLINNFSESYLDRFKENKHLKIQSASGSNYVYLALSQRNQYLKHEKVRQAIAYAIDVEAIIKNLLSGVHHAARSVLNEKHWAFNPNLPTYGYDPALANKLLDEAGFKDPDGDGPGMRFLLTYKCTDKLQSRQKAQIFQQYLKAVGIELRIQSYEWGTFFDDIQNGRFDLFSLTMVGVYEPAIYWQFFHSTNIENGRNRVAYRNTTVDELLEKAETIIDIKQRKSYYQRVQEIVAQELPYISLWHETNIAVMNKQLENFDLYPSGEWKSFYKLGFKADDVAKP